MLYEYIIQQLPGNVHEVSGKFLVCEILTKIFYFVVKNRQKSDASFRIGLDQPISLAPQKSQYHPVIKIFFSVCPDCGIPHADGIPQVIMKHLLLGIANPGRPRSSG